MYVHHNNYFKQSMVSVNRTLYIGPMNVFSCYGKLDRCVIVVRAGRREQTLVFYRKWPVEGIIRVSQYRRKPAGVGLQTWLIKGWAVIDDYESLHYSQKRSLLSLASKAVPYQDSIGLQQMTQPCKA